MAFDPKPHLITLPRRVKNQETGLWETRHDLYLEVKWRLCWFRDRFPHGSILTEAVLLNWDKGLAVYRATVGDGEGGQATGTGTETRKGFEDFVEKAETRAIGRALAALGIGTQFVGEELSEGDHIADAPVATGITQGNGQFPQHVAEIQTENRFPLNDDRESTVTPAPTEHITQDQARELKKTAQVAFGFRKGEARLRADLGWSPEKPVTLRSLVVHVPPDRYAALLGEYRQALRQSVDADVPDHPPPAVDPSPPPPAADPDRAILRDLGLAWGLPREEIEHVLSHHSDLEKARAILAQARDRLARRPVGLTA
jgi:hypothetical protein